MSDDIIKIPDIGGGDAEVIEIYVKPGQSVSVEEPLIVLESDKASMEVPAPFAGVVTGVLLKVGDRVGEGTPMVTMSTAEADAPEPATTAEPVTEPTVESITATEPAIATTPTTDGQATAGSRVETIRVPDIGAENVPVIEIYIKVGDTIAVEDPLIVLESDKATMEVPSPVAGVVQAIYVKEGDTLSQGDAIADAMVTVSEAASAEAPASQPEKTPAKAPAEPTAEPAAASATHAPTESKAHAAADPVELERSNRNYHAGPAVRKLAREFGVNLAEVNGSGPRHRILKEDVQEYVKKRLDDKSAGTTGVGIPAVPDIDFSRWGEVETVPLSRIRKIAAQNFQRAWLNVPRVTQFDECDITELEAFRKAQKAAAESRGTKLTLLPFILKTVAYMLRLMPQFGASLSADGEALIYKKYINIGIAVDTPDGLLVPVIKNVDHKSLWELAEEGIELAVKAREKKLKPDEMQGSVFTISSLGSIGGTAFTPIVSAPEVAILGVSKAAVKPIWNGNEFTPRQMLPLSLSYDHRVINGADAARFTTTLGGLLADIRNLLL